MHPLSQALRIEGREFCSPNMWSAIVSSGMTCGAYRPEDGVARVIEAIRISRRPPIANRPLGETAYLLQLGNPPHTEKSFRSLEDMNRWLRTKGPVNWTLIHFRTTAGKSYSTVVECDPFPVHAA